MALAPDEKNALCRPIPLPQSMEDFPLIMLRGFEAEARWLAHPVLRDWMRGSLDEHAGERTADERRTNRASSAVSFPCSPPKAPILM